MPNMRLTMRKVREVLRLSWDCKLSHRLVAISCSISRSTVQDYIHRANAAGLNWPLPDDLDDNKLEQLLFPRKAIARKERPEPDFNTIAQRLKRKGVTLGLEWERYKQEFPETGYSYQQFCNLHRQWAKTVSVVMRQQHQAGHKTFSDFAGKKLAFTDRHTGLIHPAHLFVSVLGASNYTFAEAFHSENAEAWCTGQANAFRYFEGCPEIIVPDNPRTVVDKPCKYEPDIHREFQHMADHFGVAVIPARVRKPRDKAKVEAGVKFATTWIIAALEDQKFFSLAEINMAVKKLLERLNKRPFKKQPDLSRKTLYEKLDKPALKALPQAPYEYTRFGKARLNIDYHISVDGFLYSAPYQYARKELEYRETNKTVEIFFKGTRIASHPRLWIKNKPHTLPEHMPSTHRAYADWTPVRIINWAATIGNATAMLTEKIMTSRQHPEQGFKACLGIIRLGKTYGNDRLEKAAQQALSVNALSYKSVELILKNRMDQRQPKETSRQLNIFHSNVRGASAFVIQPNSNQGEK